MISSKKCARYVLVCAFHENVPKMLDRYYLSKEYGEFIHGATLKQAHKFMSMKEAILAKTKLCSGVYVKKVYIDGLPR